MPIRLQKNTTGGKFSLKKVGTAGNITITSPWTPRRLFVNNEAGVWYDPSDFSTLFQDSAGTQPVTALGQPVGTVLDKSRGGPGPELVTNGDFGNNDTGWSLGTGWTVTGGTANAVNASSLLGQVLTTTQGKAYLVEYTISNYSAGSFRFQTNNSVLPTNSGNGTFRAILYQQFTGQVNIYINGFSFTGSVDNITVREIPGTHLIQPTPTSRPTLQARANLLTETEFRNGLTDAQIRGGAITATSMSGYAGAIAFGYDPVNGAYAYKTMPVNGLTCVLSVVVEMTDGQAPSFGSTIGSSPLNTFALVIGGVPSAPLTYTVTPLGGGRFRVTGQAVGGAVTNNGVVKYVTNDSRTFSVTAYDLRLSIDSRAVPYQRVTTATDYADIGLPRYLQFDGVDDGLYTAANLDMSGTDKVTVCAGVTKLSDAAIGNVAELTSDATAANSAWVMQAPGGAAPRFDFRSRGTVLATAEANNIVYAAPQTRVVTGVGDISGDKATLRLDGAVVATATVDQGSGNYSSTALFVGNRNNAGARLNGRIHQLIVRGTLTDNYNLRKTEEWVNSKTRAY